MNIDITNLVIAVIGVLLTVVTAVVVPLIKTKLNANQIAIVERLASIAVYAAQQLFNVEDSQQKKEYAVMCVKDELSKYGISFSEEDIEVYIESALKSIKVSQGNKW